jgi:monothiol glutaredoxin
MDTNWKDTIEKATKENKVMVFMRGSRETPRCGFSARVVKVLNDLGVPYKTEDMDSDPALWQTLTALNNWPTSPQIYINGEFIGGCDILMELNRSGELKQMVENPT